MLKKVIASSLVAGMMLGTVASAKNSHDNGKHSNKFNYLNKSANNYEQNTHGVISPKYAAKLITNWEENKPAGKRNLFVMQVGNIYGFSGTHDQIVGMDSNGALFQPFNNGYIKSNHEAGVYVFDRTAGCTSATPEDTRGDGVSGVPKPVFTLQEMDEAFMTYGIDAKQDVIMLVLGSPEIKLKEDGSTTFSGGYIAGTARMWYTLSYWGFPQDSIMFLNGQASNVLNPEVNPEIAAMGITRDEIFTENQSQLQTLPMQKEWRSVSEVRRDGTYLQATMGDMMEIVNNSYAKDLILDARSEGEYLGTKAAKTEYKTCGEDGKSQCYTAFNGHISGANNLAHKTMVNYKDELEDINSDGTIDYRDATISFKSVDELKGIFAEAGYSPENTVYTYCRTGTKASLLTYASAAILGYKTRMYDGSWIQWGKMTNEVNVNGEMVYNPWSTEGYTESFTPEEDALKISPINLDYLNLDAENTNDMIEEDQQAKLNAQQN